MTIKRLGDEPINDSTTQLVYGDQGVGKTWYLGTAGDRSLFISLDGGDRTLKSPDFARLVGAKPLYKSLDTAYVSRIGKASDTFDILCDTIDQTLQEQGDEFDFICIDSLTALARHAQIKGMAISKRSNTLAEAVARKTIPLAEVGDMGTEQQMLQWFLDTYTKIAKSHKKHLILTAHRQSVFVAPKKDGKTVMGGEPVLKYIMPMVVGKNFFAPNVVPQFFDEVWYFTRETSGIDQKRKSVVKARTQPNSIITAKSRNGGIFNEELTNPNLLNAIKAIEAGHPYSGEK